MNGFPSETTRVDRGKLSYILFKDFRIFRVQYLGSFE